MTQQGDSKKRIAFPIQLSSGPDAEAVALREIHIVPTGEWEHWSGEKFSITQDTIRELVANFKAGVRKDIPITAGHDFISETPAVGWFTELIDRGANGLYGLVKWNEEGLRLLSGKMFKYFSAELAFNYRDLETEKKYEAVLVGGALTNKPFFKQLDMDPSFGFSEEAKNAVVLSFSVPEIMNQFNDSDPMNIKDILAKKPEDLTVEEKSFLVEHKDELTDEQKGEFASVIDEPAADAPADEPADEPVVDKPADEPADIAASDKSTVTISASDLKTLKDTAEKGAKALEKIEASERTALVGKLVFSDSNKAGRFLPKQQKSVEAFVASLNDAQRTAFSALIQAMPESKLFSEIGDAGKTEVGVFAEVETAVKAARAADAKLSYADASKKVFKENPELAKRYNAAVSGEEEE